MLLGKTTNGISMQSKVLLGFIGSISLALSFVTTATAAEKQVEAKKPNVLFFLIDDMRVNYGPYAKQGPLTPNLDKLADNGVAFNKAYSNIPVCGASRASMLTGIWGSKDRFLAFSPADKDTPEALSLPNHFKNNGYKTISLGKVFNNQTDKVQSWSEAPWRPTDKTKLKGKHNQRANLKIRHDYQTKEANNIFDKAKKNGLSSEAANVSDFTYLNGQIAEQAMVELEQFKKNDEAFFLAVGFKKPHLPFNSPKKYWDMYNRKDLSLAPNPEMAIDAPKEATHSWGELRSYYDIPNKGPIANDKAIELIHGYHAATSYSDALVGQVMAKLKELNLDDNTIIVVWGDHGWSLGEHGLWAKHSAFNVANQVPLIINAPKIIKGLGSNELVESVDIYPSLVELANLPKVAGLHGTSFVKQLSDSKAQGKSAVFTRWKNSDTIRTQRFHLTEWRNKQDKVIARMMYDHKTDPDELVNIAEQAEYQTQVAELHAQLQQHIDSL